jgi:acyl carrier protein
VNSSNPGTNQSATLERIEQVVRSLLNNEDISLTAETWAADVPGWDSLAHVSIIFGIEEEFGIRFSDEALVGIETVGDLAERVEQAHTGGAV